MERLDDLLGASSSSSDQLTPQNQLKDLVETFQQELGRLLTPFEIEDLTKTLKEDGTSADLIKEALREAVLNGNQLEVHSGDFEKLGAMKVSKVWLK